MCLSFSTGHHLQMSHHEVLLTTSKPLSKDDLWIRMRHDFAWCIRPKVPAKQSHC